MATNQLLLALGANLSCDLNTINFTLRQCVSVLDRDPRLKLTAVSSLYVTTPLGCVGRQPVYHNAVIELEARLSSGELLRLLKSIERRAGRRKRAVNAARRLDLDIIDHAGRVVGWPRGVGRFPFREMRPLTRIARQPRGWLTLPHPEMHRRRFVLEPLAEIAPHWQHPVLKASVSQLLARLPRPPGQIRRTLDSKWFSCDTPSR